MNLKKAKKMRKAVGFHPADKREYKSEFRKVGTSLLQGTIRASGLRRAYQAAKQTAKQMGLA